MKKIIKVFLLCLLLGSLNNSLVFGSATSVAKKYYKKAGKETSRCIKKCDKLIDDGSFGLLINLVERGYCFKKAKKVFVEKIQSDLPRYRQNSLYLLDILIRNGHYFLNAKDGLVKSLDDPDEDVRSVAYQILYLLIIKEIDFNIEKSFYKKVYKIQTGGCVKILFGFWNL